ncbi:MAG: putative maltokinase, partial [Longimicrobiaceae bacterium]
DNCQWGIFLRNHDELTLEMVTDEERDYMWAEYAKDPRMKANIGIRRRLAPLLENDINQIELFTALLLSLPGSPVLYYGDEIGMGDNIWLGDRDGVRTPMQWTPDRNAGFSRAEAARLYLPAISDSVYGFQAINVEAQEKSPFSLLNWTRRLVRVRKQHHAFGRGSITFLEPENPHVLAYLREYDGDSILVVNNLSGAAQAVRLDLSAFSGRVPVELLGETEFLPIDETPYALTLSPYAFFWFGLRTPRTAEEAELHPEVAREWAEQDAAILESPASVSAMVDALPHEWLLRQRWFRGKAREIASVELAGYTVLRPERAPHVLLARVRVRYREGEPDLYLLPLTLRALEIPGQAAEAILSHATEGGDVRVYDALADRRVAGALLDLVLGERTVEGAVGRFTGHATAEAGDRAVRGPARPMGAEQSNTSVVFGEQYVLKIFRRLEAGTNPDLEVSRFLVEEAGFRSIPPLAGWIEYEGTDGAQSVAGLFRYVPNRGDAWSVALTAMERFLGAASRSAADPDTPTGRDALYRMAGDFFPAVQRLGETTARMHLALATPTDDPAFAPEPVGRDDVRRWADGFRRQVDSVLGDLGRRLEAMPAFFPRDVQPGLARVVHAAADLRLRAEALEVLADAGSVKARIHGDYHLGQVLRGMEPAPDGNEWYPIDFEGEPARPLEERRAKFSVLRDVAGMLRSFDYAVRVSMADFRADDLRTRMSVQRWADAWRAEVRSLFLSAYRETLGDSPVVPRDPDAMARALAVFELEKAVYELGYELNNRPDWIRVPLQAVLALAGEDAG